MAYLLHNFHNILPLVFPIVIWGLLLLFLLSGLCALNDGVQQLRRLHQIPCDRCVYHTGSPYLRCPVNPLSAFSENALCCQDYEPIPKAKKAGGTLRPVGLTPFCSDTSFPKDSPIPN
ncbi:hypothetical protein PN498_03265 [Oscillatoria sp. CS-180]|uniref:hypothetical protein n=1 Tax=Oscillatoria sp. CS-180 TaxID=3021720 RepID=UPI00232E4703|nr:hypothetical protein [Oscillatoria sp. CS-180]MDB9524995.1 hypothetical protein [Oscillatoria sp. CS-180]